MSRRAGAQASHMTAQPSCDRRGLTGRRFFDFPERTPCDPVPPTNDSAYGGVGRSKSVAPSVVEGVMKDWRPSAKGTKDYHSKTLYNNVTPSGYTIVYLASVGRICDLSGRLEKKFLLSL